jgi:hypothetical protein
MLPAPTLGRTILVGEITGFAAVDVVDVSELVLVLAAPMLARLLLRPHNDSAGFGIFEIDDVDGLGRSGLPLPETAALTDATLVTMVERRRLGLAMRSAMLSPSSLSFSLRVDSAKSGRRTLGSGTCGDGSGVLMLLGGSGEAVGVLSDMVCTRASGECVRTDSDATLVILGGGGSGGGGRVLVMDLSTMSSSLPRGVASDALATNTLEERAWVEERSPTLV